MASEGSFLVEDFINAITTQLDRVQDALRLKAVNRPLTYALKDISLDLQVFVEVDHQGNVRFRSSAANEAGASTIRLGFTTITKPMIEENTISLAMSQSPHLEDMGLDEEEKRRLEQFGVRNAAQLQELRKSTDTKTVSRLSGIPIDRLRKALAFGNPQVSQVVPEKPPVAVQPKPSPTVPTVPQPKPPVFVPPIGSPVQPPKPIFTPPAPGNSFQPKPNAEPIKIAPGTKRLNLFGSNLVGGGGTPEIRLNNKPLNVADADEDYLTVEMPDEPESGALEIIMPGGEQMSYELSYEAETDEPFQADGEAEFISRSRYESRKLDSWNPEPDC